MRSKVLRTVCILACLAMLLSVFVGCGAMRKEVTVIFSSADYSSPEAVCKLSRYNEVIVPGLSNDFKLGHAFRGWSFERNSDTVDIKTGDLIRYGDIEEHIKENVVNMYPVWVAGPELVIGWDAREDLSGLNERIMENFQAALNNFVQELNVGELNVVVRRYWAETTPEIGVMIRNDADVDVLLGFGDNISSSTEAGGGSGGGGVPIVELKGNIPMGGKTTIGCRDRCTIGYKRRMQEIRFKSYSRRTRKIPQPVPKLLSCGKHARTSADLRRTKWITSSNSWKPI